MLEDIQTLLNMNAPNGPTLEAGGWMLHEMPAPYVRRVIGNASFFLL